MIPAAPDCAPVEQRRLLSPEDRQRLAVPPSPPEASPRPAYADRLQPSSLGWVSRRSWCVWIEPDPQPDRFSGLWRQAVDTALARWGRELTLQPVERADDAHIRLWRRRPPARTAAPASDGHC